MTDCEGISVKFLKSFKSIALAVAALAAVTASPAQAEWLEARTRHFVITGDTSQSEIRKRAQRLEQFDAAMRYLLGTEEGAPVHLFLLRNMSEVQQLANDRNVGGFYSASALMAQAFMPMTIANAPDGFDAESVLFHEYTHHMLLGSTTVVIPRWATEGLAEMFMTARIANDGSVTIGAASMARQYDIRAMHRWSVEELLRRDSESVSSSEVIERYSRGWALCHYLWMSGERPGQYVKFISILNKTGNQVDAGKEAFGDLAKLDRDVDAYLRRSSYNVSKFTADQLKAQTDVAIRPMSAGEAAMIQLRMQSARGVDKKQAENVYARALPIALQYPQDPVVQTWFAEMALDSGRFAEADQAADRAIAIDPNQLKALAFKGRVAAQKALTSKDPNDWKSARALFLRANRVDPNDPYPFTLYYDSFAAAGVAASENAVAGLFRAVMVMPQDLDLRVRAAIALLRLNEVEKARIILAPAAFNPHGSEDNPMAKLLKGMDEGKPANDLLAIAHELKLDGLNDLVPPEDGGADKDNSGDSN